MAAAQNTSYFVESFREWQLAECQKEAVPRKSMTAAAHRPYPKAVSPPSDVTIDIIIPPLFHCIFQWSAVSIAPAGVIVNKKVCPHRIFSRRTKKEEIMRIPFYL